ncbi:peptide ABC transporter permease [Tsukamurella pulmonis]|uniref:Oligopeptide transport system permease protein n=1 Tax=Tsukamurella pulmonis TaxID=47312 RepID=A0A1H1BC76_9ACTN|nr:ABC transporter permease [Tsukamurella pulmonis]KXO93835.1 peptide ABC transporter permease [Tsukamurella pulmonis]SDQ49519.1 oligopeptide transport system permease protein [Tsukamurella pulmonis]SUP25350.1 Glutathione transport system permease protein gsiD [Tsukamurella pulmonis]
MPDNHTYPGQERFVAAADDVVVGAIDAVDRDVEPTGFWKTAWLQLKVKPLFWVCVALLTLILLVVLFPGVFAFGKDPHKADLGRSLLPPSGEHWFGTDLQGYDIYARTIYGARASVLVGVLTTIAVVVIGGLLGATAGFYGGWLDSLIARLSDVFFGVPLMLAAVVVMQMVTTRTVYSVVLVLAIFSWPQIARIARSAAISIRNEEFIDASKSLGSSKIRTLFTHVIPNCLGPVIVVATVALGVYIVTEATLSYLGIGLPGSEVSWGLDIADGQELLREGTPILFFPASALALTVLTFMMLGDVLSDALDPKARKR